MGSATPNYHLYKTDGPDPVDNDTDLNENWDKLDAHAHSGTYVAVGTLVFNVKDYGAVGDGTTNDTVAIQAAITAATASQGIVWFPAGVYAYGGLTLPKGVSLCGSHVPSADATTSATGSTLLRTVDSIGITLHGTNRTTNRIGSNRFSGIRFKDSANVSTLATLDCKYADMLTFENVSFWQNDNTTTWGHAIAAEECWDWRFDNTLQKGCGNASASKYGIYVFNGANDNCNDWRFTKSRFQEPNGLIIYFDSSGASGQLNKLFDFVQCKFEDARSPSIPDLYIDGDAQEITFTSCLFAGSPALKHINITASSLDWNFLGTTHLGVATATGVGSVDVAGSRCKFIGAHFNSGGLPQLLNITGANNVVIGCTQTGTTNAFNAGMPTSTVVLSPQLGGTALALAPGSTSTKGIVLNAPAGQSVDIFDVQLNSVSKLKVVSGGGITVSATLTLADTINIATNTTAGSKIGTSTSQKLGFFNATPVVQESGSNDVLASLVTLGLRAASSNPPLNLGSGALTAGASTLAATTVTTLGTGGLVTLADGNNVAVGTSSGSKIGTATTQKLGFFNATPVVQEAGGNDVLASLVTLGLRAASSNPPLNLGTGQLSGGSISLAPTATGTVQFLLNAPSGQSANIFDVQLNSVSKLKVVSGGGITVSATMTLADTINIATNATTGSKIGTATTQKLGFWNATPVVQQARPTDAASIITLLTTLGLCA